MAAWLNIRGRQVLLGIALVVLPLIYFTYTDVSWHPLNPHEHLVQNVLAYFFLVLFSYVNHTVFVPRWFLAKQYRKYALITVSCVLAAAYFRIESNNGFSLRYPRKIRHWPGFDKFLWRR